MPTPTLIPASTSFLREEWRGSLAVLGRVQTSSSSRDREGDRDLGALRRFGEDVDVAHDHRPARDQLERIRELGERLEAAARQAVAPSAGWYGSVAAPIARLPLP